MDKEEKQFIYEGVAKAIVSSIPVFGGAMGSVLSDALADRKEKRIIELIDSIRNEMEEHKSQVKDDFFKNDEFLDVIELTVKKVADETSEEKRLAFKNILIHGILPPHISYRQIEYHTRLLDSLTKDHLILLKLFHVPESYSEVIPGEELRTNSLLSLIRKLLPTWQYEYLYDHLTDLENNRLVEDVRNHLRDMAIAVTLETLKGKMTGKGKSFVTYILR